MSLAAVFARLKRSLAASSGTIVFGMEDGAVSIFGLVFGVAARRGVARIVMETVSIGIAAALAGVAIGMLIGHSYNG
jgi:hypothetical protein